MTWTKTQNLTLDLKMYCTLALQPRPYDLNSAAAITAPALYFVLYPLPACFQAGSNSIILSLIPFCFRSSFFLLPFPFPFPFSCLLFLLLLSCSLRNIYSTFYPQAVLPGERNHKSTRGSCFPAPISLPTLPPSALNRNPSSSIYSNTQSLAIIT